MSPTPCLAVEISKFTSATTLAKYKDFYKNSQSATGSAEKFAWFAIRHQYTSLIGQIDQGGSMASADEVPNTGMYTVVSCTMRVLYDLV